MRFRSGFCFALVGAILGSSLGNSASAQDQGLAKPNLVLQQIVGGLPASDQQLVRLLTASFKPGDKTVAHTHRLLELDGRAPITVKPGEAMVEPQNVTMTGYNRSATEMTKVVIFYVSAPDTPFLDPLHH